MIRIPPAVRRWTATAGIVAGETSRTAGAVPGAAARCVWRWTTQRHERYNERRRLEGLLRADAFEEFVRRHHRGAPHHGAQRPRHDAAHERRRPSLPHELLHRAGDRRPAARRRRRVRRGQLPHLQPRLHHVNLRRSIGTGTHAGGQSRRADGRRGRRRDGGARTGFVRLALVMPARHAASVWTGSSTGDPCSRTPLGSRE